MTPAPLPESCSASRPLFRGEFFAIDDWHCAGHDSPGRHEEWCEDDRVVFTRRGTWELEVTGTAHLADTLSVTCWNGQSPYRVRHPLPGGDRCTLFRLTERGSLALRTVQRRKSSAQPVFATRSRMLDGPGYLLHRRLLERARRTGSIREPLPIEEAGMTLLGRVALEGSCQGPLAPATAASRRYVRRAREMVAQHYRSRLTIGAIAREAGCSPFHLSRQFRRATGLTLYRTVVRHRLRDALERLLDEPASVARIALEAGFASHSHFTDAFRVEYGCPPSMVRRLPPR